MAIALSDEIVYYHKLLKMLESYRVYPNLILDGETMFIRRNLLKKHKGERGFYFLTRCGQHIFHHVVKSLGVCKGRIHLMTVSAMANCNIE
jgi:hypothetical protein